MAETDWQIQPDGDILTDQQKQSDKNRLAEKD
jgi:hypothetical protein